jgi:hypothetical protein
MMRLRRMQADWADLQDLVARSPAFRLEHEGTPPERYTVTFHGPGLVWRPGAPAPSLHRVHQWTIDLHLTYPRQRPGLHWLTPIFHPNILPPARNGGVCTGRWAPAESLADLCVRLAEMVVYQRYNLEDPLDSIAAAWVRAHRDRFPLEAGPVLALSAPPTPADRADGSPSIGPAE